MLLLDRLGPSRDSAVEAASKSLTAPYGQRFAMGGVAFELLTPAGARSSGIALDPEVARYCVPIERHPVVADVMCSVAIDDSTFCDASPYGGLELPVGSFARLNYGEIVLSAPRVRATLRRVGPHRYACSARVASAPAALTALLQSIVAVVAHDSGGAVVHAAGVELGGRAVAYVGRSGAGKSTAAALTDGSRMFARDRMALIPFPEGNVLAYGMPGGKSAAMPYSERVVWPLASLFRIARDGRDVPKPHVPRVRIVCDSEALFLVRSAFEAFDLSPAAEQTRLETATAIARATKVGTLHTVLGASIGALVSQQLALPKGSVA